MIETKWPSPKGRKQAGDAAPKADGGAHLNGDEPTLVRAYTIWPTRNTFCCYGYCMTGPKEDVGPNACAWGTILGMIGLFLYLWGATLVSCRHCPLAAP